MHQIHQGKEAEGKPDLREKCLKQAKMKAKSGSQSTADLQRRHPTGLGGGGLSFPQAEDGEWVSAVRVEGVNSLFINTIILFAKR